MQIAFALLAVVFGPFDGNEHRLLAARDQSEGARAWPRKGRVQLHPVEYAEAPRGAGADIDQAPARFDQGQGGGDGGGDLRRGLAHRGDGIDLVVDQHIDQLVDRIQVKLAVLRAW